MMNPAGRKRLETLRADYHAVAGASFTHFYCPILFRDEDVPLSRGHIINKAFRDSSRIWTIQRKDVDSFFGAHFESNFESLQERGQHTPLEVLADPDLAKRLRPRITFKGQDVPYYYPSDNVPDAHSKVIIETPGRPSASLVLKLNPAEALTGSDDDWNIRVETDVRLPALVSLLKAAHLTMFHMLGYAYGLSAGGHLLGFDALGRFFLDHAGQDKPTVVSAAEPHFRQFVNLIRPVVAADSKLQGTVSDGWLYLCTGTPTAWAALIFVRTGAHLHAVLVPLMEDAESAARFVTFLSSPSPRFEVRLAKFYQDRWEVAKDTRMFSWPEANYV